MKQNELETTILGMLEWREDMKNLLFMAGLEAKNVVFIFNDTQVGGVFFITLTI